MTTRENLEDAFAGESQATRRYVAYAKQAAQEGFTQVARLFRAAARAEKTHAMAHLRVMGGIRSTAENLQEAIRTEHLESCQMYPEYMTTAMHEGEKAAMLSFSNAMEVEKVHHRLYINALDKVAAGEDLPEKKIYVCSICGNTVMGEPPETCPVCGSTKEKFEEVR